MYVLQNLRYIYHKTIFDACRAFSINIIIILSKHYHAIIRKTNMNYFHFHFELE